jgi:hypothetical protein
MKSPINSRCADAVRVLAAARREAEQQGVEHLFVLGDVFDTADPTPQLVAEVQAALSTSVMDVHVIVGNHDQVSDQVGDHALVSMDGHRRIKVYERPEVVYVAGWQVHLVPYRPGRADDYLPGIVAELHAGADQLADGAQRVLGLHLGLRDDDTPPWLQNAHDSSPVAELARLGLYKYVMAGNWHLRKAYPVGFQVGALVPTGFDNPGLTGYGSLIILDGDTARVGEVPGPRFLRATGLAEARKCLEAAEKADSGWQVYFSVRCRPDEVADVRELFELYGQEKVEILAEKAAAESAARDAAAATAYASPGSLVEAVTAYVQKMPLPEGVERTEITQLAVNYLAGAAS